MIRYVGYSKSPHDRFQKHLRLASNGVDTHCYRWIRSLGQKPELWILDPDGTLEDEVIYIELLKSYGYKLTNMTVGGTGGLLSDEAIEKIRQKATGKVLSDDHRQKLRLSMVGKNTGPKSVDTKKKMSEAHKGTMFSSDHLQKLSHSKKGKPWSEKRRLKGNPKHSDETKRKISVGIRSFYSNRNP